MNDNQNKLLQAAMSKLPPFLTSDPVVNHAVDQMMEDSRIPYDENLYREEIEAWKRSGGILLGYTDGNNA